jgi:hypothetical protein
MRNEKLRSLTTKATKEKNTKGHQEGQTLLFLVPLVSWCCVLPQALGAAAQATSTEAK